MIKNVSFETQQEVVEEKKTRGRPAGSKNKPKEPPKPVREMQTKIVKLDRVKLTKSEVLVFESYVNKIVQIIQEDATGVDCELYEGIMRWKNEILEKGYTVTQSKVNCLCEMRNRVSSLISSYKFYNSKMAIKKIERLNSLYTEICDRSVHTVKPARGTTVNTNVPKKTQLEDHEVKLFRFYANKLISIIYHELSNMDLRDNILNSTILWRNTFIKKGYNKQHEIITSILERITLIKAYYQDEGLDVNKNFLPLEDLLTKHSIYVKYMEKHPKYDYKKL